MLARTAMAGKINMTCMDFRTCKILRKYMCNIMYQIIFSKIYAKEIREKSSEKSWRSNA